MKAVNIVTKRDFSFIVRHRVTIKPDLFNCLINLDVQGVTIMLNKRGGIIRTWLFLIFLPTGSYTVSCSQDKCLSAGTSWSQSEVTERLGGELRKCKTSITLHKHLWSYLVDAAVPCSTCHWKTQFPTVWWTFPPIFSKFGKTSVEPLRFLIPSPSNFTKLLWNLVEFTSMFHLQRGVSVFSLFLVCKIFTPFSITSDKIIFR